MVLTSQRPQDVTLGASLDRGQALQDGKEGQPSHARPSWLLETKAGAQPIILQPNRGPGFRSAAQRLPGKYRVMSAIPNTKKIK